MWYGINSGVSLFQLWQEAKNETQDVVHVDDSGSFRLSLRFIYGIVVVRLLFEFSICVLMSIYTTSGSARFAFMIMSRWYSSLTVPCYRWKWLAHITSKITAARTLVFLPMCCKLNINLTHTRCVTCLEWTCFVPNLHHYCSSTMKAGLTRWLARRGWHGQIYSGHDPPNQFRRMSAQG